jgi:carbonic anhydrase
MLSALEALEELRAGNHRFVSGQQRIELLLGEARRLELVEGQEPCAVIVGCSDSRVPVELVFDQGPGDLFVIRVAGHVVAPSVIGSVEFAADKFGTRLIVVLGHTQCGAVQATVDALQRPVPDPSQNMRAIVERIRPAVEELIVTGAGGDREALVRRAVRANVRVAANSLRHGSALLERLAETEGLVVVGAEYSLETGAVEFFEGVPRSASI